MDGDERNGMSPEAAGKYIAKIALKPHVKPIYTLGFGYKCLSMFCKLLPCRLRNWIVGWYQVKGIFVENSAGNRFLYDTYGSKWLAFEKE